MKIEFERDALDAIDPHELASVLAGLGLEIVCKPQGFVVRRKGGGAHDGGDGRDGLHNMAHMDLGDHVHLGDGLNDAVRYGLDVAGQEVVRGDFPFVRDFADDQEAGHD